jgi:hypothetical protein
VITHLLTAEYLRPKYAVVPEWLRLVRDDVVLPQLDQASREADRRVEELSFDFLQPEPWLRVELAPYCPAIAE